MTRPAKKSHAAEALGDPCEMAGESEGEGNIWVEEQAHQLDVSANHSNANSERLPRLCFAYVNVMEKPELVQCKSLILGCSDVSHKSTKTELLNFSNSCEMGKGMYIYYHIIRVVNDCALCTI